MFTFKLDKPSDLLAKLKHDIEELEDEVTSYRFFNFAVTGYHIIDWIKENKSVSGDAIKALKGMYKDEYISVCRDIANSAKHFEFQSDYKNKRLDSVDSIQGYGVGRFGKGLYGTGEEQIILKCLNGKEYKLLDFSHKLLERWSIFFQEYSIP